MKNQIQCTSNNLHYRHFLYFQALSQDVNSHRRLVDSVLDKAQGVANQATTDQVQTFIKETPVRYGQLLTAAKVRIGSL